MNKPLSDVDIKKLFGFDIPIVLRKSYIISDKKPLLILYEQEPNIGHWTILFDTIDIYGNQLTELFDSYGLLPDDQLSYTFYKEIKKNILLNENLGYNQYPLQSKNSSVCGYHCFLRYFFRNVCVEDYFNFLLILKKKWNTSFDNVVYRICKMICPTIT